MWCRFRLQTRSVCMLVAALALFSLSQVYAQSKGTSGYVRFWNRELERIGNMDLYGVTSQLPKGYLAVKWDYAWLEASKRYDNRRKLGPIMPAIEFKDGDKRLLSIDMGLKGKGEGHTFQLSYGILDELDWYIEVPFISMDVAFHPRVNPIDEQGNKIDPTLGAMLGVTNPTSYSACEFMNSTLPRLGRPTPAIHYKGEWLLGDINTGFSWNYYRTSHFSAAITPRVYLPTGYVPEPENDILYGTGPALETGLGGWAVGFTQGYDVRLFRHGYWLDIIASSEFTATYAFAQKRRYPTNFVKPDPNAQMLDPNAFPDLSDLSGTFTYRPGWSVEWTAQIQFTIAFVGLGVGYGISYSQEPELIGDSRFIAMAKSLELLGEQTVEQLQLAATLSLLPFYIPAELALQYRKTVDGYNAIVYDNYFQITVKTYAPLFLLWQ